MWNTCNPGTEKLITCNNHLQIIEIKHMSGTKTNALSYAKTPTPNKPTNLINIKLKFT